MVEGAAAAAAAPAVAVVVDVAVATAAAAAVAAAAAAGGTWAAAAAAGRANLGRRARPAQTGRVSTGSCYGCTVTSAPQSSAFPRVCVSAASPTRKARLCADA